jgi:LacI family transcriptional regulator
MIKKEVTTYDLAGKLNLSTATVSRVLNDDPSVRKKTRKAILETARAPGYRLNNFASNLHSQKIKTIGTRDSSLKKKI